MHVKQKQNSSIAVLKVSFLEAGETFVELG